jgi:hypothetical protein
MKPLELAKRYMEIFFSAENLDELGKLFSKDFSFVGPFYKFESPEAYITSLKSDPPKDFNYKILKEFEDESSACLVYQFTKPGIITYMTQMFEVSGGKITKILLSYDSGAFN